MCIQQKVSSTELTKWDFSTFTFPLNSLRSSTYKQQAGTQSLCLLLEGVSGKYSLPTTTVIRKALPLLKSNQRIQGSLLGMQASTMLGVGLYAPGDPFQHYEVCSSNPIALGSKGYKSKNLSLTGQEINDPKSCVCPAPSVTFFPYCTFTAFSHRQEQ